MGNRFGMHLTPEQLVDAADDVRDASVVAHLSTCLACQQRVSDLRATMASLGELGGEVGEPSPLFWDSFQQRVVEAVATQRDHESAIARLVRSLRPAILVPAAAALIVAAAVLVTNGGWRSQAPTTGAPRQASLPAVEGATSTPRAEFLRDSMEDDPSLQLIADLAVDVDWTAADAAALAPGGSAEHAVSHLDANDLKELQRLLRVEMGT